MKVVQYIRVSTAEQASNGTSLESQKANLDEWVERSSAELVATYEDAGFTGKDGDRPGLKALLNEVEHIRFDTVVITRLDRLARNLRLLLEIEAKLREHGINLVSISENINTGTAFGRMVFQILGIVGEWERAAIIERTTEGRHRRYARGEWGPGNALFGYRYNPDSRRLEIDEGEAAVVRYIYDLYVFERLGFEQIALRLNAEGRRPRQHGSRWHPSAVKDIVAHPGYKGKHPTGVALPLIVQSTVWDLAQQRRKENPHLRRPNGSPWLLQGLLKCGLCGHQLACTRFHQRRVYSCRGRLQSSYVHASNKCRLPNIDAKWLEAEVTKKVLEALSSPQGMEQAIADTIRILEDRKAELEKDIQPIEGRLEAINAKLRKMAEQWLVDILGGEMLDKKRRELQAERERLTTLKAQLDPKQVEEYRDINHRLQVYRLELEHIRAGGRDGSIPLMELPGSSEPLGQLMEAGTTKMLRQVLDRLQVALWVYPDRVEVKAMVPVQSVDMQVNDPTYRLSHCPQSL
jgi:site-specific DNA recombinase